MIVEYYICLDDAGNGYYIEERISGSENSRISEFFQNLSDALIADISLIFGRDLRNIVWIPYGTEGRLKYSTQIFNI